jgi:DNA-binding HxlR family transcriptional regulator/putative sterol carrier protein
MLVMRELFLAPKRFTDLEQRLEGIAPNLLSRRLKELEAAGLIRRRRLDPPAASTVYELTEKASGLESAMLELARWGVQFLGAYEGEQAFELEWLLPAMEELADREAARGVWETYEFRIDGSPFWVNVADGEVTVRAGHSPETPDLLVESDMETFMGIGFGAITPEEAQASGRTRVLGDAVKAERAVDILAPTRIFSRMTTAATPA